MNEFANELIAIARCFGSFERLAVCCGRITVQQCATLQMLLDEAHDITWLAQRAGVSNSAMTRLVDGLEERRWVRRVRAGEDRRRVQADLTAAGRREAQRLHALTLETSEFVLAQIPKEKHEQVISALRLVRQAFEATRSLAP